jgi:hypothetical protein
MLTFEFSLYLADSILVSNANIYPDKVELLIHSSYSKIYFSTPGYSYFGIISRDGRKVKILFFCLDI